MSDAASAELPVGCCVSLPVEQTLPFPSDYRRSLHVRCRECGTPCRMLREPPGRANLAFSVRLPAKLTCPMPQVRNSLSDAARASRSSKPCLFRPTTGEAYMSDAASAELPVGCCVSLPVEQTLPFPSDYRRSLHVRCRECGTPCRMLREPPGRVNLAFSVRLPAKLTCPMPRVRNSLSDAARASRSSKPCLFRPTTGEAYMSDAASAELLSDAARASRSSKPCLFRPTTGEAYPFDAVSIEVPSDAAKASQLSNLTFSSYSLPIPYLFHPTVGEAYPSDAMSIDLPSDVGESTPGWAFILAARKRDLMASVAITRGAACPRRVSIDKLKTVPEDTTRLKTALLAGYVDWIHGNVLWAGVSEQNKTR